MKKYRNLIAMFLCMCLAAGCLAACGKAADEGLQESDKKAEESADSASEEKEPESGETEEMKESETKEQETEAAETKETEVSDIQSPSVCGKLSVEGTKLVDENGETVQLRGLSTHGLAFFPQYVNEALFSELRQEWKANVIRLAMYTAESGGYCTDGDQAYLKDLIRSGVAYATSQDMYVIVDWHILSDNNPNQHKGEAIEFFREMSEEFSGHNNVIYEICNEPNGGTSWAEIKAYAEEVIPVIRASDSDAVILVGTPNWSQYVNEAAADPVTGYDNIMYTLHFYAATHKDDLRNTMTAAVDAGLPVFVSEYGICDASGNGQIDEAQADAWVKVMDQYGISYVAWNISNKNESSAIIKSTVNKTSGLTSEDLSDSGRWLYQMLTGDKEKPSGKEGTGDQKTSDKGNMPVAGNGQSQNSGQNTVIKSGDIEVTATLANQWEADGRQFYQYGLVIKNTSDQPCQSWEADVKFNDSISLSDSWNGVYAVDNDTLHISSVDYNGKLSAGESTDDVGFIVSGAAGLEIQENE